MLASFRSFLWRSSRLPSFSIELFNNSSIGHSLSCTQAKFSISFWEIVNKGHRRRPSLVLPPTSQISLGSGYRLSVPAMGFIQSLTKKLHSNISLPSFSDLANEKDRIIPRLSFFKRRIRLKGNSKISVPLGAVLLFPCVVIILIIVLIVRHPSSPGSLMMPAGAPPAIR